MSMLRKKERDLQAATQRLSTLEEASNSSVKQLHVLQGDRRSFRHLCDRLQLHDAQLAFETADAQGEPVDLDDMLHYDPDTQRDPLHNYLDDLKFLCDLVFPNDPVLKTLFLHRNVTQQVLHQKWMEAEMKQVQAINAVTELSKNALSSKQDRISQLEEQLNIHLGQVDSIRREEESKRSSLSADWQQQLRHAAGVVTERPLELEDVLTKRVSEVREMMEVDKSNAVANATAEQAILIGRLKLQLRDEEEALERTHEAFSMLIFQQESEIMKLKSRVSELEAEQNKFAFVEEIAARQAERDREVAVLKHQLEKLQGDHLDSGKLDYIKNVVIKWMDYVLTDDPKQHALLPVICTVLDLSDAERVRLQPRSPKAGFIACLVFSFSAKNFLNLLITASRSVQRPSFLN